MTTLNAIYEKCRQGQRLSKEEGLKLYLEAPLIELGDLAHQARLRKVPEMQVTWVADTNLNYTNVCDAYCTFCAFYRTKNAKDAYTFSVPQMVEKIKASVNNLGVTTVLIQGGLNPDIPFSFYTDFVSAVRREVPEVHPHFFSAPEIWKMVEVTGKDIRWVLTELHKAGLDTLPGGGAEILTDRVRLKLSKTKVNTENWLAVHAIAHEIGYRSTATMMFGHLDEAADIVESLEGIRGVQDESKAAGKEGFTAFIPWSFKPDNTPLGKKMGGMSGVPGPAIYLRILALSRLFLDNIDHIQASWFSEGKKTGQMGLYFGADDFGGTIFEENVLFSANHECKTTYEEITKIIHEAGFKAAQRDTKYNIIKYWDETPQNTGHSLKAMRPLALAAAVFLSTTFLTACAPRASQKKTGYELAKAVEQQAKKHYLQGVDAYADYRFAEAISQWKKSLALVPGYLDAEDYIQRAENAKKKFETVKKRTAKERATK